MSHEDLAPGGEGHQILEDACVTCSRGAEGEVPHGATRPASAAPGAPAAVRWDHLRVAFVGMPPFAVGLPGGGLSGLMRPGQGALPESDANAAGRFADGSPLPINLDNNATTEIAPEVLDAMLPFLRPGGHGNPSSTHALGRRAKEALEGARETAARVLGAEPDEIAFTPNGTYADNLALLGFFARRGWQGRLVTTTIEHPAVLRAAEELERRGVAVTRVAVGSSGVVDAEAVRAALPPDAALVSIMLANHEVGTLQPVRAIAAAVRAAGVAVHTDAVQAFGKVPVDVNDLGVDLLALSAHKFHGPQGVGLLYARRGSAPAPLAWGGGQEHGLHPGTESVALAVGMATAMRLAAAGLTADAMRVGALRDRLWEGIRSLTPGVHRHGDPECVVPNTLACSFEGVEGPLLTAALDQAGIALSAGSACHAQAGEPSEVLTAMGVPPDLCRGAIRFSLCADNRGEEIEQVLDVLPGMVERLRGLAPHSPQLPKDH